MKPDPINSVSSDRDFLEEEFTKLSKAIKINKEVYRIAQEFFEAYVGDEDFRDIIDTRRYVYLRFHPSGYAFYELPKKLREDIISYIKQNVNILKFADKKEIPGGNS